MIRKKIDVKNDSTENFIEADQLVGSHRRPVAWMLALQVALFGLLLIGLASPSLGAAVAMVALLSGFLWYVNSVWLTAFLMVVVGAQVIQTGGRRVFFIESAVLLSCVLIVLMLVVSFRYIELRSYSRVFQLGKSYRGLKATKQSKLFQTVSVVLGQLVRRQWYHSLFAMIAAFLLLRIVPATKQWTQDYWLEPAGGRFIFLAFVLFLGWFVCRALFSMWDWFGLSPKQADVAMRSWANREFWSEMAGVERRVSKLRRQDLDEG